MLQPVVAANFVSSAEHDCAMRTPHVKCKVRSVKCKVSGVECGVQSVER